MSKKRREGELCVKKMCSVSEEALYSSELHDHSHLMTAEVIKEILPQSKIEEASLSLPVRWEKANLSATSGIPLN